MRNKKRTGGPGIGRGHERAGVQQARNEEPFVGGHSTVVGAVGRFVAHVVGLVGSRSGPP